MFKYLLIGLFLFTKPLFSYSDGTYIPISSNSFGGVYVGSATAMLIPSTSAVSVGGPTVDFSSHGVREIVYANMSSSETVFFSTSSDVSFILEHGFPIFPQSSISVPIDPTVNLTTNTTNLLYFLRQGGGTAANGLFISVRAWLRYILTRDAR